MTIFLENVLKLVNQKGVTKNKMLVELKLGKNSFVNWEQRDTIPSGETLSKIAAYFEVSTDYLLGNETKDNAAADKTDHRVQVLARKTKDLPEDEREALLTLLDNTVDTFLKAKGKKDD